VRWALLVMLAAAAGAAAEPPPPTTAPASGLPARAGGVRVYREAFDEKPGREWSVRKVETSPAGGRTFLGQLHNETAVLKLDGLPPHRFLRVSFDLLLIRTWDGNHAKDGPDVWQLRVADGPALLRTTFSNVGFYAGHRQSFPDWAGEGDHPPRTGSAARDVLGYEYEGPVEIGTRVVDSVYRFELVFPHTGDEVSLEFSAAGLEAKGAETWGLDRVRVEALPDGKPLDAEAMERLWEALAAEDGMQAFDATWRLISAGEPAVTFVRTKLGGYAADPAAVARFIAQLDNADWRKREAASEALSRMGRGAEAALKKALSETESLEVRVRIEELLREVASAEMEPQDRLRLVRAAHVLRVVNSPAAERTLGRLVIPPRAKKKPQEKPDAARRGQVPPEMGIIRVRGVGP